MEGGYQIVSLLDINITKGIPVTVKGVYHTLESTHKPTILADVVIDGVEIADAFVDFSVSGTDYVGVMKQTGGW